MQFTDAPIFDKEAAAEIEAAKMKPNDPFWGEDNSEARQSLYTRAYSPPEEASSTGKPSSTDALGAGDPASAVDTDRAPSDFATLAKEVELPEATVRESLYKFRRDPEVQPILKELDGLEVPRPEVEGALGDFYKAVVAEAKGTIDPVKTETALRQKWGREYGTKMAAANFALTRLGLVQYLRQTQAFDHPAVIMRLAAIGARLLPARAEYFKIQNDPDHPSKDPRHPKYGDARREMEQLRRKVYGGR